jgi:hypothetical protein
VHPVSSGVAGTIARHLWLALATGRHNALGTPQCLLAEGLADLGVEIVTGRRHEPLFAERLRPLGSPYDPDTVVVVAEASEELSSVTANASLPLHEDGADPGVGADEVARLARTPPDRARKSVGYIRDPSWRVYISRYVARLRACRHFVAGRPERFALLFTEQLIPTDRLA